MTLQNRHYGYGSIFQSRIRGAVLILSAILIIFVSGCTEANNKTPILTEDDNSTEKVTPRLNPDPKIAQNVARKPEFAPTVESEDKGERKGVWYGGPPPINKRTSHINTYYQIKVSDKPNHLLMKLRFEGVVADDALVRFKGIDGATFEHSDQRSEWKLKPNVVSEVSFSLIVPETISYLTLYTFQNKRGSSRAFLLEALPKK